MTTLDRALTEYRLRTVRIGVLATVFVLVALFAYVLFPGEDEVRQTPALILMGAGMAGAGLVAALPWRRLFERGVGIPFMYAWSVLDILLVTLLISTAGDSHMEMFFLYAFTTLFLVASYPIAGQVGLLAFTVACYLTLMAVQGWPIETPDLLARLGLLLVLSWMASFLSKELISGMVSSAHAGDESERRAGLLAVVADAARGVSALDSEEVLAAVVQATTGLGFDAASLALYDREEGTYRVVHPVGLPAEYAATAHPIYAGMPGMVFDREDTIVLDDYRDHPRAVPALAAEGFRAVIATPVYVQGVIAAALVGGTRAGRRLSDEDVEAFELLAALAGRALENAQRFESERRTNERLAELDRMKSDFLSNVSHELRTPLTAITGMGTTLDQLWEQIDEPDRRELLGRLNANAGSLHQIITTLLDFSQLEAGGLDVQWQDVDVVGLVNDLLLRLEGMVSSHPVEVDAPERVVVHADAVLLDRVLENLLSNAIKHTPEGTRVVVSAREEVGYASVSVADRGPGISEEELPHIGERFFRGGDPNTRKTRGTGLGLALVKEILRLHHSELEVESRPEHGSRFSFRLRLGVHADVGIPAS